MDDIVSFFGHPAVVESINIDICGESSLIYRCLDGYGTWEYRNIWKDGEENPRKIDD